MADLKVKDSQSIKALIEKVRELALRGDDGEKSNAESKLKLLMDKYRIRKFEEEQELERVFKLADFGDCKTIMVHCILDTKADACITGNERRKEIYCVLSDEQYIDVCEKFHHYFPLFYKQKDAFVKAFIIKNNLGIIDGDSEVDLKRFLK